MIYSMLNFIQTWWGQSAICFSVLHLGVFHAEFRLKINTINREWRSGKELERKSINFPIKHFLSFHKKHFHTSRRLELWIFCARLLWTVSEIFLDAACANWDRTVQFGRKAFGSTFHLAKSIGHVRSLSETINYQMINNAGRHRAKPATVFRLFLIAYFSVQSAEIS